MLTLRSIATVALVAMGQCSALAQMTVTFVGNNGVMLESAAGKVLIDSLFAHTDAFWTRLPPADRTKLFAAQEPFDGVRWSLTTHNHPDHYSTAAVNSFSAASPATEFLLPPQARGPFAANPRVLQFSVPFQTGSQTFSSPGIEIEVFHMEHFDQFGNDFSRVQDYTYLVSMGGAKLLHLGDVDFIPQNFAAFNFAERGIDAVVLPTFNTLITAENRELILNTIAPRQIIATHLRAGVLANELANVRQVYPNALIFTQPLIDTVVLGVPEPSSLVAASACLIGLGALSGHARRRTH